VLIDRIELRALRLPLVRFFETSFGRSHDRTFLLVQVEEQGSEGYGECVAEEHPYYSSETTQTAWEVLEQYLVPLVLGVRFAHPRDVLPALVRVRGHRMAKAGLEMAIWDLYARQQGVPLSQLLAAESAVPGGARSRIASGVSIGIQDSVEELIDRVAEERAAGYQRVKVKIKPGWDVGVVERLRAKFDGLPLMVDANAAYTLADAPHLQALDRFGLLMIEQPLSEDDLRDHATLQRVLRTPVCLDESIEHTRAAEAALALGACRIVNIKPGRVGGHAASVQVHDLCAAQGVPVWHGGMLESGIGRAHNIHLASLPNFTLPGDIAASARYYQPDLIEPPITVEPDGTVAVPQGPGIGVTIVPERVERATERHLTLSR
jgi:O-succinylbenzoate synthase